MINEITKIIKEVDTISPEGLTKFFIEGSESDKSYVYEPLFKMLHSQLPSKVTKAILTKCPSWVKHIPNPSIKEQLWVVEDFASGLQYISNPCKEALAYCLRVFGRGEEYLTSDNTDMDLIKAMVDSSNSNNWPLDLMAPFLKDVSNVLKLLNSSNVEYVINILPKEVLEAPEVVAFIAENYKAMNLSRLESRLKDMPKQLKILFASEILDYKFRELDTTDPDVISSFIKRQFRGRNKLLIDDNAIRVVGRKLSYEEKEIIVSTAPASDRFIPLEGVDEELKKLVLMYWGLEDAICYVGWIDPTSPLAKIAKEYGKEILINALA
ncbi:hypothetical protein ACIFOE_04645 [Paenibacillus sp. NRS-1783]|uniref:hypothetical protein n=1 Tax=Paenibacillus sp. NRS-1783 TaxID=3233907 RepID=UPI003D2D034B